MAEFNQNPLNSQLNPTQTSEQLKGKELDQKIMDLLRQGLSFEKMAELLGMKPEEHAKFIYTVPSRSKKGSPIKSFDAVGFKKEIMKKLTATENNPEIQLPAGHIHYNQPLLPPDEMEIPLRDGSGQWEKKRIIPRTRYLMELFTELNIPYLTADGENNPRMMRKLTYVAFGVKLESGDRKLILACNEEGNATFIIHQLENNFKEEIATYLGKDGKTKSSLRELEKQGLASVIEYRFEDPEEYKMVVLNELLTELKTPYLTLDENEDQEEPVEEISTPEDKRSWQKNFQKLVAYKEKYGDCNVPWKYKEDPELVRWVDTQRTHFKRKSYREKYFERYQQLVELGFDFDPRETLWQENFQKLVAYKEKYGDCNVPKGYQEDPALGQWVSRQRTLFNKKSYQEKYPERYQQLVELGFRFLENKSDE